MFEVPGFVYFLRRPVPAVTLNVNYLSSHYIFFFLIWRDSCQWARASLFTRFLDHTQRRITVGRTPFE